MRTTLNIPENLLKEAEALYDCGSRSKSLEKALEEAIRIKKIQKLKSLRGKIEFDITHESIEKLRGLEKDEQ